jgi:hypothetical protein
MTRTGSDVRIANTTPGLHGTFVYHAARFEHALAPGRSIAGVGRDKDTGAPIAGMEVGGAVYDEKSLIPQPGVAATTDAQGRYRLDGLALGRAYRVFAKAPEGSAYPNATRRVPADAPALAPLAFDFTLKRGVLIRGRVTDKATGKPVRGFVETYTFNDNPRIKDFPGYEESFEPHARLGPDGRFEIAALPGRGLIAARSDVGKYLGARGIEAIKGLDERLMIFDTTPGCFVSDFHSIVEVSPDDRAESLTVDLQVDPGRRLSGTVVDPDGRPIGGTKAAGLTDLNRTVFWPLESAEFEVQGFEPGKPLRLLFVHEGRKLAGRLLIEGDEPGPLTVRLQPWGVVTGRLVDDEGQPRAKLQLLGNIPTRRFDPERGLLPRNNEPDLTDRDGRFRIEGLIPGLKYGVRASVTRSDGVRILGQVFEDVQVGPGETKDLGDVKAIEKPIESPLDQGRSPAD